LDPVPVEFIGHDADRCLGVSPGVEHFHPLGIRRDRYAPLGVDAHRHQGHLRASVSPGGAQDGTVARPDELQQSFTIDSSIGGNFSSHVSGC
jgi:hypothetical protein